MTNLLPFFARQSARVNIIDRTFRDDTDTHWRWARAVPFRTAVPALTPRPGLISRPGKCQVTFSGHRQLDGPPGRPTGRVQEHQVSEKGTTAGTARSGTGTARESAKEPRPRPRRGLAQPGTDGGVSAHARLSDPRPSL